ncbi:MAG: pyridoxamine 5'-phosphate oxidase family protein [Pseudomonadota bacterium]
MEHELTDIDAVQEAVGRLAGPRDMKVIDFMDEHAIRWLAHATLGMLTSGTNASDASQATLAATLAGGPAGFATAVDATMLQVPGALVDDPGIMVAGNAFASLWLLPGMTETLRINGRVADVGPERILVAVEECYLHCGKALIRSDFWAPDGVSPAPTEVTDFIAASRLLGLATLSADGRADLSPKGDPAGALLREANGHLWYPDRPGNRRIDSFRNIVDQPRVAAIALIPGSIHALYVEAGARVSRDPEQLAAFAVGDKTPHLVTRLQATRTDLRSSAALERAALWPAAAAPTGLRAAEIFKTHVKLSKESGLGATLTRAAISIPGAMRRGLESDYEKNLY